MQLCSYVAMKYVVYILVKIHKHTQRAMTKKYVVMQLCSNEIGSIYVGKKHEYTQGAMTMHFNEICSHTTISTDTVDNQKPSWVHMIAQVILKDPLTDPPATPPIMPPTILPTIVPTPRKKGVPITVPAVLPIRETAACTN